MGGENGLLGVVIAVVGVVGSVLVARISNPKRDQDDDEPAVEAAAPRPTELKVSPEIWDRVVRLESQMEHLTAVVADLSSKVSTLDRLLRQALRILRRANRRLRAADLQPEEVPAELVPYSIE
ncbi:hypothetical protein [Streptomyces sp. NPDC008125]|uniref:hypothetical protein n=1 Tax=Streptomyces sp. NPDC008125 TaxID=3364811 RepID=UPI0036E5E000